MVYDWLKFIQSQLYPQNCLMCGATGDFQTRFCPSCYDTLPFNRHACPRCALPLPDSAQPGSQCGACLPKQLPYDTSTTALRYEPPLSRLISDLKFHQKLHLTKPLAELLIHRMGKLSEPPDFILPVPLHPQRLRERGFNQAQELARVLAKHYAIPLNWRVVKRTRHTQAQSDLSESARHRNLRHAFRVCGSVKGARLAILDDVITTGSTVTELSKTLKKAGAKHIEVWGLARTVPY
ncbi:MAG: ComF family protein [Candidatus Thiodiazotropha sp.]|jgi:ComF family protein